MVKSEMHFPKIKVKRCDWLLVYSFIPRAEVLSEDGEGSICPPPKCGGWVVLDPPLGRLTTAREHGCLLPRFLLLSPVMTICAGRRRRLDTAGRGHGEAPVRVPAWGLGPGRPVGTGRQPPP